MWHTLFCRDVTGMSFFFHTVGPPSISESINATVALDSSDPFNTAISMTIISTGGPPTIISWKRNGQEVPYDDRRSLISKRQSPQRTLTWRALDVDTFTYEIVLTVPGNELGSYVCCVENEKSTAASCSEPINLEGKSDLSIIKCTMSNISTLCRTIPTY